MQNESEDIIIMLDMSLCLWWMLSATESSDESEKIPGHMIFYVLFIKSFTAGDGGYEDEAV